MSAFIVSDEHINALVSTAKEDRNFRYYFNGKWLSVDSIADANFTGEMLLAENLRAVNARYNVCEGMDNYIFEYSPELSPVEIIKACHCYNHQSCETDDYEETQAGAFVTALIDRQCHCLPGYEAAPWEITAEKS